MDLEIAGSWSSSMCNVQGLQHWACEIMVVVQISYGIGRGGVKVLEMSIFVFVCSWMWMFYVMNSFPIAVHFLVLKQIAYLWKSDTKQIPNLSNLLKLNMFFICFMVRCILLCLHAIGRILLCHYGVITCADTEVRTLVIVSNNDINYIFCTQRN